MPRAGGRYARRSLKNSHCENEKRGVVFYAPSIARGVWAIFVRTRTIPSKL
jgi:hypothetical protein